MRHIVGNEMVKPYREKTETFKRFPIPETKKEVRLFLALAGHYRKFIKKLSELAAPLAKLTKKREPQSTIWTQEYDHAFQ